MTNQPNDADAPREQSQVREAAEACSDLPLEEQVAALRSRLEETQREASQNLEMAQRAQAELINFRRRSEDERISNVKYSNSRLISRLLPVTDELDLAVTHAGKGGPNASWLEGVKLIQRKLLNLLESEGVSAIDTGEAMFNPLEHEALGTEETTEYPPGYITQTVRPGYRLHDRVIQPAQVMVAREPENGGQAGHSAGTAEAKETENG